MIPDDLIQLIDNLISDALLRKSKCNQNILNIDGMCGITTRHLYNNICSIFNKPPKSDKDRSPYSYLEIGNSPNKKTDYSYLEIGCWKGASTIASLYKNDLNATVIDNWSEFGGCKFDFVKNISKYLDNQIQIINQDCFSLKKDTVFDYSPYTFFLYDGPHQENDHLQSIVDFWKYLDNTCIIIIDDWNWIDVRNGTYRGLDSVNAKILHKWELFEPTTENRHGLWNGCCIFLIQK